MPILPRERRAFVDYGFSGLTILHTSQNIVIQINYHQCHHHHHHHHHHDSILGVSINAIEIASNSYAKTCHFKLYHTGLPAERERERGGGRERGGRREREIERERERTTAESSFIPP